MSQEIINLLITLAPSIAAIIGLVVSIITALKKISTTITEFRQSNELKVNNQMIGELLKDNQKLKKINEKLLIELTRIQPSAGWSIDDE